MATFLLILTVLFIILGIIGCIAPVIPGLPIAFIAVLLYAYYDGFVHIGLNYLIIIGVLTIIAVGVDYLMVYLGTKIFGASKASTIGALIGSVVGIPFIPPLGIIVFSFLGALATEMYITQDINKSLKAAFGSFLGFISGTFFKVALGVAILISFIIKVI